MNRLCAAALSVLLLSFGLFSLDCGLLRRGQGSGTVFGQVFVPQCDLDQSRLFDPYDLQPRYYVAQRAGNVLSIRIQRDGRFLFETDGLIIDIRDISFVAARIGQPIAIAEDLEYSTSPPSPVRAGLSLSASCPRFLSAIEERGSITFRQFSAEEGRTIAADFTLDLFDGRAREQNPPPAEPPRLGRLAGSFEFVVRYFGHTGPSEPAF